MNHDMIVVGAGLTGLTAGVRLQADGYRVLIIERRDVPGGLCGTKVIDGQEFVIGCNDFGSGLAREMKALGVAAGFRPVRTVFHFEHGVHEVPLSPWRLVRHIPDALRFVRALKGEGYLGPVVREQVRDAGFADFLCSLAYGLGVTPDKLSLAELRATFSKTHAYGYERPVVPVGGPGALARALADRFTELGGEILLNTEVVSTDGVVTTSAGGEHHARQVIWALGGGEPGLAIGMFHLVAPELAFPPGVHTMAWMPPGVDGWLSRLDAGELPPEFGFHLFEAEGTVNVFLLLPRGLDDPSAEQLHRIESYVFDQAERLLPGLRDAIVYRRFVSPREYAGTHGLSSVPRTGFTQGDHAGGAVLRGLRAAQSCQDTDSSSRAPNRTR